MNTPMSKSTPSLPHRSFIRVNNADKRSHCTNKCATDSPSSQKGAGLPQCRVNMGQGSVGGNGSIDQTPLEGPLTCFGSGDLYSSLQFFKSGITFGRKRERWRVKEGEIEREGRGRE